LPMGRFESFESCTLEMTKLGHDSESANKICGAIKDRAEKGVLMKANSVGLEVLSKAGEDRIVVGGYATWDVADDEGDIVTIDAQSKALQRFFSQPKEYQTITINHKEFKVAQPILKYTNSKGEDYFTHPNEVGTYLISELRNDNLKTTQYYREEARKGNLNGYSATFLPLERDSTNPKRLTDIEYHSITLTEKGVLKPINPMARDVKTLSKSAVATPTLNSEESLDAESILRKHGFNHCTK
jgi:hypothetical protein